MSIDIPPALGLFLALKLSFHFDDGSVDECSATVDGNVCAEVGGDLSRSDRRGNKSTAGSFTCKKGVSESDAISDVAKWVDWLRSVQSWCEALGDCFAKCFVQDEQCRKLLFFVLGILPSVEGLPSSTRQGSL